MKIVPKNDYLIELTNHSAQAILKLKNQTLHKEQFITNFKNQTFIGEIKESEFEIKLSEKLFGEFCVLNGKLEGKTGIIEIKTTRIVRIIFIATMLFVFSGIIVAIIQNKLRLILPMFMTILIMRFIFIELTFSLVSKRLLNKLIEIIEIKI